MKLSFETPSTMKLPRRRRPSRLFLAVMANVTLGLSLTPALAQGINSIAQPAFGVEGYYQTKERCYYANGVDVMVAKVDRYMEMQHGYRWQATREKVAPQLAMAVNMRRITEHGDGTSTDQMMCDAVAIYVSFVLTVGILIAGPDAPGAEDIDRLASGHGRVK